jgi:hypothetical protein
MAKKNQDQGNNQDGMNEEGKRQPLRSAIIYFDAGRLREGFRVVAGVRFNAQPLPANASIAMMLELTENNEVKFVQFPLLLCDDHQALSFEECYLFAEASLLNDQATLDAVNKDLMIPNGQRVGHPQPMAKADLEKLLEKRKADAEKGQRKLSTYLANRAKTDQEVKKREEERARQE